MGKIYFIDKSLDKLGGIERVINTLANNFIDTSEVEIISYFKNREEPFFKYDQRIKFTTIINNINLKSQKHRNKRIVYLTLRTYEKARNYLKSIFLVRHFASKFKSDDILVFGRVEMALKFLPFVKNVKKVIVREAIHLYDHKNLKELKKVFLEKVDLFIVSSDENIKLYNNFFDNKLKIEKIYNPLGIVPCKDADLDSKIVIALGRYDKQKGFDVLIRSWSLVAKKHPDWKLKIMGDGYYKEEMNKLIKKLNLSNKIELTPNNPDVVSQLKKSSIYVMSSRIEGYANALVEAMTCGLACISFDWMMGVDDIIKDGQNGKIVHLQDRMKYMNYNYWNQKDVKNLSLAIIELIENKSLREKYAKESVKLISSRNQKTIISKWKNNILK